MIEDTDLIEIIKDMTELEHKVFDLFWNGYEDDDSSLGVVYSLADICAFPGLESLDFQTCIKVLDGLMKIVITEEPKNQIPDPKTGLVSYSMYKLICEYNLFYDELGELTVKVKFDPDAVVLLKELETYG